MLSKTYCTNAMLTDLVSYVPVHERLRDTQILRILHATMGICTESGELMDALKKHLMYGKGLDFVNLSEESGDLFWYVALLADAVGFTFEDSFAKNINKLRVRYPNKFTEQDALIRNLENERKILEDGMEEHPFKESELDSFYCSDCGRSGQFHKR